MACNVKMPVLGVVGIAPIEAAHDGSVVTFLDWHHKAYCRGLVTRQLSPQGRHCWTSVVAAECSRPGWLNARSGSMLSIAFWRWSAGPASGRPVTSPVSLPACTPTRCRRTAVTQSSRPAPCITCVHHVRLFDALPRLATGLLPDGARAVVTLPRRDLDPWTSGPVRCRVRVSRTRAVIGGPANVGTRGRASQEPGSVDAGRDESAVDYPGSRGSGGGFAFWRASGAAGLQVLPVAVAQARRPRPNEARSW